MFSSTLKKSGRCSLYTATIGKKQPIQVKHTRRNKHQGIQVSSVRREPRAAARLGLQVEGAIPSDVVAEETRHASTEETVAEESLHLSPEVTIGEDQSVPSPTITVEEPGPSSPLKEAKTHVVDTEVRTIDLNDEALDMTKGTESTLEYHPPEYPREEKEIKQVEEEVRATELADSAADRGYARPYTGNGG
ncbi:unnamed protein product [Calypogeia fissa]